MSTERRVHLQGLADMLNVDVDTVLRLETRLTQLCVRVAGLNARDRGAQLRLFLEGRLQTSNRETNRYPMDSIPFHSDFLGHWQISQRFH